MSDTTNQSLNGVAETLLIPLYIRALESERSDALLKDEKALELVSKGSLDFSRIKQIKMDKNDQIALVLRNRKFDHITINFISRYPDANIVHIGCGLDSRFERVDNGQISWYDLDLPEVIKIRKEFIGNDADRYHLIPYSVFDNSWLDKIPKSPKLNFLFLAEGVFMYFEETQIKTLVRTLSNHFPGSELVFDAFSPFLVRMNNFRFEISHAKMSVRYNWGLKHSKDVEEWANGITLLNEWFPFDEPEPRLAGIQWIKHVPLLAKVMGIFHYRFGQALTQSKNLAT